jgi:hypothetical protein
MVNNFTNINKVNNHLSPKESLNSDGQQFYQYQQSKIVDHHCLNFLFLILITFPNIILKSSTNSLQEFTVNIQYLDINLYKVRKHD